MLIAFLELLNFGGFDGGHLFRNIHETTMEWSECAGCRRGVGKGNGDLAAPHPARAVSSSGLPTFAYSFAQHNFFMASR